MDTSFAHHEERESEHQAEAVRPEAALDLGSLTRVVIDLMPEPDTPRVALLAVPEAEALGLQAPVASDPSGPVAH